MSLTARLVAATRPARPPVCQRPGWGSKRGFVTRRLAERELRRMRGYDRGQADALEAYRCPDCPHWHLGHKRGRRSDG